MLEFGIAAARWTDLLRLVALPVFLWAARQDVHTRRVPNSIWPPLAGLGGVLLLVDAFHYWGLGGILWQRFAVATAISIGLLVPMAYGFWLLRGFGGADAKALMVLAVLFPAFPEFWIGNTAFPLVETVVGSFALTILTNAVLIGLCYPIALLGYNLVSGDLSRAMVVGRRLDWRSLSTAHGRLLEAGDGFTRGGLDLDALRMYLRWRGIELADIRERTDELRDPASLPDDPKPPTDGAVLADGGRVEPDVKVDPEPTDPGSTNPAPTEYDDPWGAAAFLDAIDGNAYGTTPEDLREGLDLIAERETVWISPGIPFIVPMFLGLVLALTYGDLMFGVLLWFGVV